MPILALETSSDACSVALLLTDRVVLRHEVIPRGHTKRILPMIREVLAEAGLTVPELSALAFGRGPGSFTGLRIAAGVVQGLAFGANLPVVPVSSLEAMALQVFRDTDAKHVAVCVDARMEEVYFGLFQRAAAADQVVAVVADTLCRPDALALQPADGLLAVGNGWGLLSQMNAIVQGMVTAPQLDAVANAHAVALLAQHVLSAGLAGPAITAQPVYLRDSVAWKKLPGRE